jgi:hypothetical protein
MTFEAIEALASERLNSHVKTKVIDNLFPGNNREVSLSRLLIYFSNHPENRGRIIRTPSSATCWFKSISKLYGGIRTIQAYFYPLVEMTIAVIVIFLCDTGANAAVARTLTLDCLEDASEPNYKVIKGIKLRAAGKLIVDELPVNDPAHDISSVQAIQTYKQISERARTLMLEETRGNLFLCADRVTPVRPLTGVVLTQEFKRFCKRHPQLRGLGILPAMLRPSVLLRTATDPEGGIIAAAAVGDHNFLSTTVGYVSRMPSRVIWEQRIREFQTLFQAVSIYSIRDAAKKLGMTSEKVENLFNKARRTGLGSMCLNPTEGMQPGSISGQTCTQLQSCPTCQNVIIIATVENLKELVIWNHHLEHNRHDWESNRPERWEQVWLPWLVFTNVAIEQASRGRTAGAFKKAKTLAASAIAEGKVNLPPLW